MKQFMLLPMLGLLVACTSTRIEKSNHQNLDVLECRRIAQETFRSGKLNNNLCPGYMPDGQPVEAY